MNTLHKSDFCQIAALSHDKIQKELHLITISYIKINMHVIFNLIFYYRLNF